VQFALSLVFSGRECNLLILTLPESAKGRAKYLPASGGSTPAVHPNAPLPLLGIIRHWIRWHTVSSPDNFTVTEY
ncbi:MAG: hypothetical protein WD708_05575, partial [Kiritimatiellia bacterium]